MPTQRRNETEADFCRRMGWGSGTKIVGDEGQGPTEVLITAVGERAVLGRALTHKGVPVPEWRRETSWTFIYRDWTEVNA